MALPLAIEIQMQYTQRRLECIMRETEIIMRPYNLGLLEWHYQANAAIWPTT